jgi:hypothetical protein
MSAIWRPQTPAREQDQVLKGVRPPRSSIFQVTLVAVLKMEEISEKNFKGEIQSGLGDSLAFRDA